MKKNNFKFFSYFNILNIFLASFVLLGPMIEYIKLFKTTKELIREGYSQAINLSIAILITIFCCIIFVLTFYLWVKDLRQKSNESLTRKEFNWVLITSAVNIISLLLFLVAFFCLWLYPIYNNSFEIANQIRLNAFIGCYVSITIVSLIISISCVTWTNLRISYFLTKNN